MNLPTATYRMQFSPSFGFQDAKPLIAYLANGSNSRYVPFFDVDWDHPAASHTPLVLC
jgi:maltooligosyltrehalose synthase